MGVNMFEHYSVLKDETINGLNIKPHGTYVDCTVGGGGHSEQIVRELDENGLLIAFDQDFDALKAAEEKLKHYKKQVKFIHSNFKYLERKLTENGIQQVDGILFDLGVSSPQLDRGERGFSYQKDAQLDMRMDQSQGLTAYDIVNHWDYNDLVSIFFKYGEERFSKQIARKIEMHRERGPIKTTHQLVDIIKDAIPAPARRKGGHPGKRVFQAIRIAVNNELNVFNDALHQAARVLSIKGRLVVITFHSLEDRICKQAFKKWSTTKEVPKNMPVIPNDHEAPFKRITRKPIVATEEELRLNRRSRSAKLRIVEKENKWSNDFQYTEGWKR